MSEYGYEPEKVGIVRGLTKQLSRERLNSNDPNRPPRGLTRSLSGDKLLDRRRSSRANHGSGGGVGGLGLTKSSSGDRLSLRRGGGSKGSLRNLFGSSFSNLNNSNSKNNATWDNDDDDDDEDDDGDHRPSGLQSSGSMGGSFRNLRESLSRGFNNSGNLSNQNNEEFDNDDDEDDDDDSSSSSSDGDDDNDHDNNNNSFDRRSAFLRTKNALNTFSIRGPSSLSRSFNSLNASSSKKDTDDYDGVDFDGLEREMKSKKGLESREQTLLLLCKELGLMDE